MDKPKSLDSLFKDKIFRIPDYQRGYAWQHNQYKDFWEDLINLSGNRRHYTGVLTLKQIAKEEVSPDSKEYWLVKDHSYDVHHVVDGQQRLTTFIIFLQAFVDLVKSLPEHADKPLAEIYISDSLSIADLEKRYLFKVKPTGDKFRTYKFGYAQDNPSYNYLRHQILGEACGGSLEETFYTLNLSNAHRYFHEQLKALHQELGTNALHEVYEKLTQKFMFNEYVIKDEFDVFVAFETMNNRGKKLSDLELLKNRLIYLTTLYDEHELDEASRNSLRNDINDAWKEVYHQLGRNKQKPLNDDDFLRAHWTMYFKYSRQTGRDYIKFLLDEQFAPQKVSKKIEREISLEQTEEATSDDDFLEAEDEITDEPKVVSMAQMPPTAISEYVLSLKESAVHWFNTFHPKLATNISDDERQWLDALNRIGMIYFRPLIMAILKNEPIEAKRIDIFKKIERYIFLVFRVNGARANYGSSEFYNLARDVDQEGLAMEGINRALTTRSEYWFNDDGSLWTNDFYNILLKKFKNGFGYYRWGGLRYFLFEYETSLLTNSRQKKVAWSDLLKNKTDKISIEHIYPQTATEDWETSFANISGDKRKNHGGSLGNLLLLSMSINSALQNDSFEEKKHVKQDIKGNKMRNGYEDGSHSEIEVAMNPHWGPEEIRDRGLKLLCFMEKRWGFKFQDDEAREELLFLEYSQEEND